MVMPLMGAAAGAAARRGAKKLASKKPLPNSAAERKARGKEGAALAGMLGATAPAGYAVKEGARSLSEREQQEREAEAEMKRETRGMKKGGKVHEDSKKDKPMMEKVAKKAVKSHESRMHKTKKMMGGGMTYKKGGSVDGCATKGKTKGKMVKMMGGGKC
jgi:hypothetical protein